MTELEKRPISGEEMLAMLVDACPSFQPLWRAFLDEWKDERNDLPYYVALGDLARHLVDQLDRGQTSSFPEISRVIEELHVHGDGYVREAVTIGLLEGIQNLCGEDTHRGQLKSEQFEKWLGPESRRWWHRLDEFWDGNPIALRDD